MTASLSAATAPRREPARTSPHVDARGGRFPLPTAELERLAESMLEAARAGGATAAETEVSQAVGQSVTVRNGEVETIAYNRDKGIGVTVFIGQRRGHASTADFAPEAIAATVGKALAIARYTAQDPAAGLADPDRLARSIPDLDLYHPWDLPVEDAIAMLAADAAAGVAKLDCELVPAVRACCEHDAPTVGVACRVRGDSGDAPGTSVTAEWVSSFGAGPDRLEGH
jgi:hypothetical protein